MAEDWGNYDGGPFKTAEELESDEYIAKLGT
jgi:hypothetical protein